MKTTEHPIEAVRPPTPDELAEIESALAALEEAAPQIEALAERC
jgi:hypothetical protein